nr:hemerythrin family protein [uncultured Agathobaculum sp.]
MTTKESIKQYKVTPDLETGNQLIDSEHRMLFDAINDLLLACHSGHGRAQIGQTAEFLADYVDKHFSDEEELQRSSGYPKYEPHHAFHVDYKSRIRALAKEIRENGPTVQSLGQINAEAGVLINHIRQEDKRLAAFLHGRQTE